jgi:hypothetical protein
MLAAVRVVEQLCDLSVSKAYSVARRRGFDSRPELVEGVVQSLSKGVVQSLSKGVVLSLSKGSARMTVRPLF